MNLRLHNSIKRFRSNWEIDKKNPVQWMNKILFAKYIWMSTQLSVVHFVAGDILRMTFSVLKFSCLHTELKITTCRRLWKILSPLLRLPLCESLLYCFVCVCVRHRLMPQLLIVLFVALLQRHTFSHFYIQSGKLERKSEISINVCLWVWIWHSLKI